MKVQEATESHETLGSAEWGQGKRQKPMKKLVHYFCMVINFRIKKTLNSLSWGILKNNGLAACDLRSYVKCYAHSAFRLTVWVDWALTGGTALFKIFETVVFIFYFF